MNKQDKKWRVLVVDDDADVLTNTVYTLMDLKVLGRELDITTLGSATAAIELLERERDFAVILLDVVMEKPHAGLSLVTMIRHDFNMQMSRIILRTGNPGYAPERDITLKLEIDDYILKQTAVRDRIITAVIVAIRAYDQLQRLARLKDAMQQIICCSNQLLTTDEIDQFANVCMQYVAPIFGKNAGGGLAYAGMTVNQGIVPLTVMSATSEHESLIEPLNGIGVLPPNISVTKKKMTKALEQTNSIKTDKDWYIYIKVSLGRKVVLWLNKPDGFDEIDETLGKSFANTIKACLDRLCLLRERMAEAMVSIGIFAHEFRTPIASMRMSNEFMLESLEAGECDKERFKILLNNTDRILNGMNRHIDSSMINVGVVLRERLELPVARVNIGPIVRESLEVNKNWFSKAGQMRVHIEDDCWARADGTMFEYAFVNLVGNAIKALSNSTTHFDGPKIEIELTKQDGQIRLVIADHGSGIRADQLDKIFDPFYSTSGTPAHGLGLTMVKRAVQAMGGTIECSSEVGVGTTFVIQLNAFDVPPPEPLNHVGRLERRLSERPVVARHAPAQPG
ncbi:response regulator receiver sensor signal transduction histidine kinase (plasmid) [Rhodoferax ferrireducens T118]|uniref:histidine kinase n=1 Tax=Albidiferax ferrireducens (strain ATCC BAA-621 / DSM 15236 / T118) TaxID=338969 RepID=Q21Q46_ALBFT|nr:DUF3369 domain-containing protein [Rhodoferax ferrireducens]ABD72099.1 response regulator receiver sensor signal transduction histidine kinase [Rhodoferax ferrireducens T118]